MGQTELPPTNQTTILFCPINSAGHLNGSLAIADRLKRDHNYRCVFLLIGPYLDESIQQHGHELRLLEDLQPYEDYELEPGEDTDGPADEALKRAQGKTKRRFVGAHKWPQMIVRNQAPYKRSPLEGLAHRAALVRDITLASLESYELQMAEHIERLAPALVVADVYFPAACLLERERRGLPWVRVHSANPLVCTRACRPDGVRPPANCGFALYTRAERERMSAQEPARWARVLDEWRSAQELVASTLNAAYEPIRDWYAAHGGAELRSRLGPGQPSISSLHLNIYMYPAALDYDQEDDLLEYPARWLRCESLVREPAGAHETRDELHWRQLLRDHHRSPLVFFSLGSIASANVKLMQRFVNFLAQDVNHHQRLYVVSKGVNGDKYELPSPEGSGGGGGGRMIGANFVPQTLVLRYAHLAIVHGGNNTITECLHFGVPMIVLPNFADQWDNAQRVQDLALGRRLDLYKCTQEELLGAVDALLADAELRERVRAVGERMRALDELGKVSDVLRNLVERRDGSLDATMAARHGIKLAHEPAG